MNTGTPDALYRSDVPGFACRSGKVRDVYDLGDALVVVATDRISAFDWIMPTPIPQKGRLLTEMTLFWLKWLNVPDHRISTDPADMPEAFRTPALLGRSMLVKKTKVFPVECVVRGYLVGSGWQDYQRAGGICGVALPKGLKMCERLPEAIFTPSTKAETGHDENITFAKMQGMVGADVAETLRHRSMEIYRRAAEYALSRGVIVADTKMEYGVLPDGEVILIDEVLTPDSSRFWPGEDYEPGKAQPSFDKQYLRDWLDSTGWNKNSPPPALPPEVVARTGEKYREALAKLTG